MLLLGCRGILWASALDEPEEVVEHAQDIPRLVVPRESQHILQARRVLITHDMIARYGPSPGCAKCRAIHAGDVSRPALGHSEVCRARIEEKWAQDPPGAKVAVVVY